MKEPKKNINLSESIFQNNKLPSRSIDFKSNHQHYKKTKNVFGTKRPVAIVKPF